MDVFRVFDALNDVRNLRTSVNAVKKAGKHAQGTICYTISPVHTSGAFVDMAEKLMDMGSDSICLKDMAGLLKPQPAYDIVKGIKDQLGPSVRVHVHTHATTGVTLVSLMKAIEAGADMVDTAISTMSFGPGNNPTESLIEMLEGTGFTTRVDMDRVRRARDYFRNVRPRYKKYLTDFTGVETDIFESQIPGGMLSNMESQLKQQGAGDKVREVLEEVPRVRKDSGYPPLVTPTSQIVGTQAVFNVMMGRYKVLSGEFADLMLGYYGETLGPKDQKVLQQAAAQTKKDPITCRPADLIPAEWDKQRADANALEGANGSDEDVLTYAMFPQVAPKFFKTRSEGPKNPSREAPAAEAKPAAKSDGGAHPGQLTSPITYNVTFNGHQHKVTVAPSA